VPACSPSATSFRSVKRVGGAIGEGAQVVAACTLSWRYREPAL